MFQSVLIANRGEIALRVIRACKELGISTIAIYTEADRDALHVRQADRAFGLGEASYLSAEAIAELAVRAGADGVHPGYGFLSENADFARAVTSRGIAWIGPHPEAISLMGSKTVSRRIARDAGVPIVPGTTEALTDPNVALAFGEAHGYPFAIKAAAGGGGRGLVVVRNPSEVEAAVAKAIREGESYFGSGEVYMERYLDRPRHIEVQVLADKHGRAIHLGERECSIQRRHQKLIEECPSPALTPELRAAIGEAAVRMAHAVAYDSAGTVEFLYQDGEFFFLEMNTRIQVEHTVTEMVYGCDLVKEQIRIAAGMPMSEGLESREPRGWAIECRINAEDPSQGFRPSPGRVSAYHAPGGPGVRIDGAVFQGWRIPDQYDSLLAKVCAWGENRTEAIARMRRVLDELVIEGVPTTTAVCRMILDTPEFESGAMTTHFIGQVVTNDRLAGLPQAIVAPVEETDRSVRQFQVEVNKQRFDVVVSELGGGPVATLAPVAGKPKRPSKAGAGTSGGSGTITAPMHALVQRVLVDAGQTVEAGAPLLVLEAMKMETEMTAPFAGVVTELAVTAGQTVEGGARLAVVTPL